MKRIIACIVLASGLLVPAVPAAAASNDPRQGSDNAFIEVAKTTGYGALAGLLVGGAIALAQNDGNGEPVRWGFVVGTFAGMGYGLYHVNSKPKAEALLEFGAGGATTGGFAAIGTDARGVRVRAVSFRFR